MNKDSGRKAGYNPFSPLAFAASLALVLVFSGVIVLLSSMTTAADGTASITIKNLGDFRQARDSCPDVFVPHKVPGKSCNICAGRQCHRYHKTPG